jgi:hypothetical protein
VKQYTSPSLKTVAMLYMAYPAAYLLSVGLLFDVPAAGLVRLLLSPFFWFVSLIASIAGYGLWEMRRWAWYVFLAANLFTAYSNALVVSSYGKTSHKLLAFLVSLVVIALLIYRVAREVRVPYFLPKIRWWESDPRYKLSSPARLSRTGSDPIEGEILDLSMGGCFVKLRQDLLPDEPIRVSFELYGVRMDLPGIVVWRTQSTVTHPKGVGVKFAPMARPQRARMRAITHRLREIAQLHRTARYLMSTEEFHRKLAELQSAAVVIRGLPRRPEKEDGSARAHG